LAADVATLTSVLPTLLNRPIATRPTRRIAWTPPEHWAGVDDDVAVALTEVAKELQARPVDVCGTNPLAGADVLFSRIRATDALEPIATMSVGRADELTASMQELLATPPLPRDPEAELDALAMRAAAKQFFRSYPVLVCPVATCVAPFEGAELAFDVMLAPSRAVSLLGVAALSVPAGRNAAGVPIGVQLVGRVSEVIWAAQAIGVSNSL
jgi:Asp-tRNA(Asn)/Glu-tRNA(Gln) amidotransferase A subunit family amidase